MVKGGAMGTGLILRRIGKGSSLAERAAKVTAKGPEVGSWEDYCIKISYKITFDKNKCSKRHFKTKNSYTSSSS